MKIYLAGPWRTKAAMPTLAAQIEAAGHTITERWWEQDGSKYPTYPSNEDDEGLTDIAIDDAIGVMRADALIVINTEKSEGKAAEAGIALALNKPIMLVGTRSMIFHYLPSVYPVASLEEALEKLS